MSVWPCWSAGQRLPSCVHGAGSVVSSSSWSGSLRRPAQRRSKCGRLGRLRRQGRRKGLIIGGERAAPGSDEAAGVAANTVNERPGSRSEFRCTASDARDRYNRHSFRSSGVRGGQWSRHMGEGADTVTPEPRCHTAGGRASRVPVGGCRRVLQRLQLCQRAPTALAGTCTRLAAPLGTLGAPPALGVVGVSVRPLGRASGPRRRSAPGTGHSDPKRVHGAKVNLYCLTQRLSPSRRCYFSPLLSLVYPPAHQTQRYRSSVATLAHVGSPYVTPAAHDTPGSRSATCREAPRDRGGPVAGITGASARLRHDQPFAN